LFPRREKWKFIHPVSKAKGDPATEEAIVLKAIVILIALVVSTSIHAQPTSAWSQPGAYQAPQSAWNDRYLPPKSQWSSKAYRAPKSGWRNGYQPPKSQWNSPSYQAPKSGWSTR
jgi:hypothetical protein